MGKDLRYRIRITKEEIKDGLKRLGIKPGYILLVHSSLSSMGYVEGGADTVIDALLEVVGREGTIVMPTYSTGEAGEFYDAYDPQSTPVWTGRIPEVFRQREGAVRSLHLSIL